MPTPTLTCACEYASGSISKPSSAKYFRYFIVNSLLPVRFLAGARPPDLEVLQLFVSEAPTDLNSEGREKLRREEWLISAILREISQLRGGPRTREGGVASGGSVVRKDQTSGRPPL